MRYEVTLSAKGGHDKAIVEAASGDEAAAKAHKSGTVVIGVHPAPAEEAPAKKSAKADA